MRARDGMVWLAALGVAGCAASERAPPDLADDSRTATRAVGPARPEVYVVVADDRPDAAKLRETLVQSFADLDLPRVGVPVDPAAFHPVDRRVIVAHPSAPGAATITSELEMPTLHWHANQKPAAEQRAWLDALARAFELDQPATDRFVALAAYERATSLAIGARAPETDEEAALVATLPAERTTYVVMALAHEDESDGDAATYAVPLGNSAYPGFAILPRRDGSPASPACYDFGGAVSARYQAWVDAQRFYDVGHWPCSDASFLSFTSDGIVEDCYTWSPLIDADGVAACTATAHVRVEATCDPAYGWLDPMGPGGVRTPRVEHDAKDDYDYRVCEVRQLTGSALESCRHSLDCPDCEPGWCATEVPELLSDCSTPHPDQFRFVQGSDTAAQGRVIIRCAVAGSP